jgi:hypothetical protein
VKGQQVPVVVSLKKQHALLSVGGITKPRKQLLASSKTADTAQPAQRVSQAEPPLFFFLMFFMYASSSDGFRQEAI